MKKHSSLLLSMTVVTAIILAGCGKSSSASTGETKQVLNMSVASAIQTMDASHAADSSSIQMLENVGEGLVTLGAKSKVEMAVAKKVTVSADGLTYTFDLREGTKWNDGTEVTAQDFVYAWQRTVDPKTASEYAYLYSGIKNADAIMANKADYKTLGIAAPSKYQVKVTLERPVSYFEKLIAMPAFLPQEQKVVEKYGKAYGTAADKLAFNGPFTLKDWDGTGDTWTLAKNPHYWDKSKVKLTKITWQVVKDTTTGLNLYQSGKLDQVLLGGTQVATEKNSKDYVLHRGGSAVYLQPNLTSPSSATLKKAFNNLKIRQALSMVLNRKQFTAKVLNDGSLAPKGYVTSGLAANESTGEDFAQAAYVASGTEYDAAKAKKLWKEGLKEIGESKLAFTLTADDDSTTQHATEYVQGQWESQLPGLDVTIKKVPKTARVDALFKGDFDMVVTSWGADYADPSSFLALFQTDNSMNFAHFSSKDYDDALTVMNTATDSDKRWDAMVKAEKYLMTNQICIPLYEKASSYMQNPKIKNLIVNAAGTSPNFKLVYVGK